MIESMVCFKCKTSYTCVGALQKAYKDSIQFMKTEGRWRPICADKEECKDRQRRIEPACFTWNKSRRLKDGT